MVTRAWHVRIPVRERILKDRDNPTGRTRYGSTSVDTFIESAIPLPIKSYIDKMTS